MIFRRINQFMAGKSMGFILATVLVLIASIGILDYVTGSGFELDFFYLLPIFVAAWYSNERVGIATAVFATLVWVSVGQSANATLYPSWGMQLWNAFTELGFFLVIVSLLSRLKSEVHQLDEMAREDALTGLANRRSFYEVVDAEINRSRRFGSSFSVAYIDIDNFKTVNDTRGHSAGDALLRQVASTIAQQIRNVDTAARLGGDEFAILFPETKTPEIEHTPEMVRRLMLELPKSRPLPISVSIGVATFLQAPASIEETLEFADKLMYLAKMRGKNAVTFETWPGSSRS